METKNKTPRSVRNNNPLNIRRNRTQWQGMKSVQTDRDFVQFETMAYGWRAAFIILTRSYYLKYNLSTPEDIISRWAPATENNVRAYVDTVCGLTGFTPRQRLQIPAMHPAEWMMLAVAMAIVEGGTQSLDYFEMMRGWELMRKDIGKTQDNK